MELLVAKIVLTPAGLLSVMEKEEEQKEKDWACSILVVGFALRADSAFYILLRKNQGFLSISIICS